MARAVYHVGYRLIKGLGRLCLCRQIFYLREYILPTEPACPNRELLTVHRSIDRSLE